MAAYTWTTFPSSGSANFETTARAALEQWRSNADDLESKLGSIADGTIDAANITVGSGKTLNVSAGTLTLADNQISGDKVEGGTINAVTVTTLTSTTAKVTTLDTNVAAAGVTLAGTTLAADGTDANININLTPKGTGEVNITKVDIDNGTIDGTDITVGSGKTLNVSAGTLTLADNQISGDKIHGGTISAFASTGIDDNADAVAITIDSSENVGIGTASPTAKLSVAPIIYASSQSGGIELQTTEGQWKWGIKAQSNSVGDPYLTIDGPIDGSGSMASFLTIGRATGIGNIGIGTTSPVNKLDVEGGVAIGATYSGTSTAPTNGLIVEGNVGIGTASPTDKLDVIGTAVGSSVGISIINYTPYGAGVGYPTARVSMGHSTLAAASAASIMGYIECGNSVETSSATGHLILGTRTDASNVTEKMRITSAGNVGIGTTSPVNKLDVEGAVAIGASYSGTSTAPTNGLIVEGDVGIGTASPKAALDVGGVASGTHYGVINSAPNHATAYSETSTSAAGEPGLYIQNKHNSGAMASIKLSVRETAQSIWEISNVRTADYLGDLTFLCRFGVSTFNERMRITSSGNVGIGTASPTAKLHLPACTAAANTASLKIDAGTVATTPVSGNIESDGVHLWWTNAAGTRIQLDN